MIDRYIGILKPTNMFKNGNIGDIWELKDDGYYHCINRRNMGVLVKTAIEHDVQLNYLKKIK